MWSLRLRVQTITFEPHNTHSIPIINVLQKNSMMNKISQWALLESELRNNLASQMYLDVLCLKFPTCLDPSKSIIVVCSKSRGQSVMYVCTEA